MLIAEPVLEKTGDDVEIGEIQLTCLSRFHRFRWRLLQLREELSWLKILKFFILDAVNTVG